MSDLIEPRSTSPKPNPLFWIILIVAGLVAYILLGTDRGVPTSSRQAESGRESTSEIDRKVLVPPGMRAREMIEQVRSEEVSYPFESLFSKALEYQQEGSLADAHLLFFFCAREGFVPAMMKMAELSDPTLFRAGDSLLDQADAIQAYKWYQKAAAQGQSAANGRVQNLQKWAVEEAEAGNPYAHQLLLVIQ